MAIGKVLDSLEIREMEQMDGNSDDGGRSPLAVNDNYNVTEVIEEEDEDAEVLEELGGMMTEDDSGTASSAVSYATRSDVDADTPTRI